MFKGAHQVPQNLEILSNFGDVYFNVFLFFFLSKAVTNGFRMMCHPIFVKI